MAKFEWDERKAILNVRKHSVSFAEAATVLLNEMSETVSVPDHSISEKRFITFGHSVKSRLLVVSWTWRGQRLRIISARKATSQERQLYEKH